MDWHWQQARNEGTHAFTHRLLHTDAFTHIHCEDVRTADIRCENVRSADVRCEDVRSADVRCEGVMKMYYLSSFFKTLRSGALGNKKLVRYFPKLLKPSQSQLYRSNVPS